MPRAIEKLHIGLVAAYVGRGSYGLSAYVASLTEQLCQVGSKVTVLAGDRFEDATIRTLREAENGRVSVQLFPIKTPWDRLLNRSPGMRRWLRTSVGQLDLVEIQGTWSLVAVETAKACLRAGVPYIITPHGMMARWDWAKKPWRKRIFFSAMMKPIWERAAAIRFLSNGELLNSAVDTNGRSVIVPNFVKAPERSFNQEALHLLGELKIGEGAEIILFLGRVTAQKGVLELVAAFDLLWQKRPQVVLLIVGPLDGAYGSAVMERVNRLPSACNIRMTGALYDQRKNAALAASSLFVTLSKNEGLPIAALEAISCGLPVVLTQQSNLLEIEEYGAGLIVKSEADEVANSLLLLLSNRAQLQAMSVRAKTLFEERFSRDVVMTKVFSLYQRVAASKRDSGYASTNSGCL
jgi:glycosyltransferase involved in cell wall biosynthesis